MFEVCDNPHPGEPFIPDQKTARWFQKRQEQELHPETTSPSIAVSLKSADGPIPLKRKQK